MARRRGCFLQRMRDVPWSLPRPFGSDGKRGEAGDGVRPRSGRGEGALGALWGPSPGTAFGLSNAGHRSARGALTRTVQRECVMRACGQGLLMRGLAVSMQVVSRCVRLRGVRGVVFRSSVED